MSDLVLERFHLIEEATHGAQGTVWRARDRVSCRIVAVKVLPGLTHKDVVTMGREVAALRLLRIPGIVPLIDAGAHGACGCVAMEWIDGHHFPSLSDGARWDTIETTVRELLETLARVHAVGIVHRDLKPANILVDASGHPTVLDLGVAGGAALASPGSDALAGTPRYMAPVLFEGARPSPATDLFSIAVMVFEALTGSALKESGRAAFFETQRIDPSRVARDLEGLAPPAVVSALARILSSNGAYEGGSKDLLCALDAGSREPAAELAATLDRIPAASGDLSPGDLESLFDAEERIVAHRSTCARILYESTGGRRTRVISELESWISLGIGRVRCGRLVLDELDVERVERRHGMRGLVAQHPLTTTWLSSGLFGLAEVAFAGLDERIEHGELREALAELPTILSTFVQLQRDDAIPMVLHRWLRVALFANDRRALSLLLHEINRGDASAEAGVLVAAIATAALAAVDGSFDRARERLDTAQVDGPFELSLSWHAVNVYLARRREIGDEVRGALERARRWAASVDEDVPELESWAGWIAFLSGDYAGAQRQHLACAAHFRGPRRAQCLLDAGAAALEQGSFDAALAAADQASDALLSHRHPFAAGRVEWLRRAALYRSGRAVEVDEDLVRIAGTIGAPQVVGLTLLTEASIAWRHGSRERAVELAEASTEAFVRGGLGGLASAPAALGDLARRRIESEQADARSSVEPDLRRLPAALAVQVAELWLRAGHSLKGGTRTDARAALEATRDHDQRLRREVLALDECSLVRRSVISDGASPP